MKYGYGGFSLEILEYCDRDKVIEREQYYIDLLKPEYNILQTAGSSLGFKYSEDTKAKMKVRSLKQKEQLKNLHANPEYQAKRLERRRARERHARTSLPPPRLNDTLKILDIGFRTLKRHIDEES